MNYYNLIYDFMSYDYDYGLDPTMRPWLNCTSTATELIGTEKKCALTATEGKMGCGCD